MEKKLLAVSIFACLAGGCATNNPTAADQPRDEGVVLTGSRIPQKSTGSGSVSQTSREGWEDSTRGHKQINPQGR